MSKCGTLILLLAVTALALAGCGSSDDSGASSEGGGEAAPLAQAEGDEGAGNAPGGNTADEGATGVESSSLSKAQYVNRASAICAQAGQQVLGGLASLEEGGPTPQSEAKNYEELNESVLLPTIEKELRELRALGAPAGEAAQVEGILAALQQGIDANRERPPTSLEDFGLTFSRFDQLAGAYGLSECVFFG